MLKTQRPSESFIGNDDQNSMRSGRRSMSVPDKRHEDVFKKLNAAGQAHVLRFWDELNSDQRQALAQQVEELDFALIAKFAQNIQNPANAGQYQPGSLKPFNVIELPKSEAERVRQAEAKRVGEEALRKNKVGVIVVAGGQGTRLRFDDPKGVYPVGPITTRSLFQYHTEKIMALERKYGCTIPFYIMTSEATNPKTIEFFDEKKHFGKDPNTVIVFKQGMLPPLDLHGKMFLGEKGYLSMSPDGHGGVLKALINNRLIEDMAGRSLETLFYFQVDNVMVKICDPVFIGFHLMENAEMSAKTVYKRDPDEKLGHVGTVDGKSMVVEYTELSKAEKNERNADGRLKFGQGSIAIHAFSRSFFQRLAAEKVELLYHMANKSIPYVDENGNLLKPVHPNGFKFEQFIFDAIPYARKVMIMETDRNEEFAPIKNKEGEDSPATARQALSDLLGKWLEQCGHAVKRDPHGYVVSRIEISPLFAMDDEELCRKLPSDFSFSGDLLLE
jgi:UDP-N-acetylglucosamine/UDP-N-acetylgalactosamine diphosphorylase